MEGISGEFLTGDLEDKGEILEDLRLSIAQHQ